MKTLLKGGTVVNPGGLSGQLDVLIEDGKVLGLGADLKTSDAQCLDVSGMMILPGLIDMHVHLREPGQEYKETIQTGTMAAAAGGFSHVACMPNTTPVVDNEALVAYVLEKARQAGYAKVLPIAAVTKGQKGKELAEFGMLKLAGAIAFSDDGHPVENDNIMRNALVYAKNFDALILSHCEELSLVNEGVMNEGLSATLSGLRGNTRAAEEVMIARECTIARAMDARIHICHVSTEYGFEIIRHAKAQGVKVTCETCPHYFALTDEACMTFDTNTRVNPPLRTEQDRLAAIAAIADGTVDAIVTDHAPHHIDDKDVEFDLAANGISGLETSLPLSYETLVLSGAISLDTLITRMAVRPAQVLGIDAGVIRQGGAADIAVFDPNHRWTVTEQGLYTKGKNSAWMGKPMQGRVMHMLIDGRHVVDQGKIQEGSPC